LDLRVGPVAKRLGDTTVRMLGYNGSIPGPTLKVRQGSEIIVHVVNEGDLDTTVHWHGLRLENKYDGVPHETQAPIPVGGEFTYLVLARAGSSQPAPARSTRVVVRTGPWGNSVLPRLECLHHRIAIGKVAARDSCNRQLLS
jgi:hypothetical protein